MRALKWIGYIVAALVVLSVIAGLVLSGAVIVAIVLALTVFCGVVLVVATLIRSLWEEVFRST